MRLAVLAAAACSGGGDYVALDGAPTTSPTDAPACDGADTYVAGLSKTTSGSGATVILEAADPTPPDVGDNRWTLRVEADGAGIAGLPVVVEPWMPLHGHGLVPPEYAAADLGEGGYEVEPFDLIMPGLWEFRVRLAAGPSDSGAGPDEALFRFCAEG